MLPIQIFHLKSRDKDPKVLNPFNHVDRYRYLCKQCRSRMSCLIMSHLIRIITACHLVIDHWISPLFTRNGRVEIQRLKGQFQKIRDKNVNTTSNYVPTMDVWVWNCLIRFLGSWRVTAIKRLTVLNHSATYIFIFFAITEPSLITLKSNTA